MIGDHGGGNVKSVICAITGSLAQVTQRFSRNAQEILN